MLIYYSKYIIYVFTYRTNPAKNVYIPILILHACTYNAIPIYIYTQVKWDYMCVQCCENNKNFHLK